MTDFRTRARTFARAVRQMPNNVAAVRRELETRTASSPPPTITEPVPTTSQTDVERLDDLTHSLTESNEITTDLALATVTDTDHHRITDLVEDLQSALGRSLHPVLLAPGSDTDSLPDGVLVRTPDRLEWTRAVYVLVHASPAEHTVLLHPTAIPEPDTLADMLAALTGAQMATATVIENRHGTTELANPTTICAVNTRHARATLTRTYRRTAMTTPLDTLSVQSGGDVRCLPRLAGTVTERTPA